VLGNLWPADTHSVPNADSEDEPAPDGPTRKKQNASHEKTPTTQQLGAPREDIGSWIADVNQHIPPPTEASLKHSRPVENEISDAEPAAKMQKTSETSVEASATTGKIADGGKK